MAKSEKMAITTLVAGRTIALQLMNDDPTPPATPPAGDPPKDTKPPVETPPADTKPFATFPDEKSFMSRIDREAKKQKEDFLKSLGIEGEDSLKAMIEANKQRQLDEQKRKDDELTETQKLQKKLDTLETEKTQALTRAETIARTAEAKQLAATLGVSPTRVNHFIKLADISDIKVNDDGSVDIDTMKTRFEEVLKDLPEFRGQTSTPQGGSDFGGGGGANTPKITKESIKTMTTDEIAANIVEVRRVLALKQ